MYLTYSDPVTGAVWVTSVSPMIEWSHTSVTELRTLGVDEAARKGIDVSTWIFNVEVD